MKNLSHVIHGSRESSNNIAHMYVLWFRRSLGLRMFIRRRNFRFNVTKT